MACKCNGLVPVGQNDIQEQNGNEAGWNLLQTGAAIGAGYAGLRYGAKIPASKIWNTIGWYALPATIATLVVAGIRANRQTDQ